MQQVEDTYAAMKRAQRFVLSPLVLDTASNLGRDRLAIERSAGHFFLPAETTWLDMTAATPRGGIPGARHGVLLIGDTSITKGAGFIVAFMRQAPEHETDWEDGGFVQLGFTFDLAKGRIFKPFHSPQVDFFLSAGGNIKDISAAIWSAVALINTRRIVETREADLSRLNRARLRQRKPPILQYKIVTISVDRTIAIDSFRSHETEQRALHHVRAFLRIKRGRVELVRPHWRGNPRFGVIVHRYVALREEDEAGAWQGGPLPASKVIKELDE